MVFGAALQHVPHPTLIRSGLHDDLTVAEVSRRPGFANEPGECIRIDVRRAVDDGVVMPSVGVVVFNDCDDSHALAKPAEGIAVHAPVQDVQEVLEVARAAIAIEVDAHIRRAAFDVRAGRHAHPTSLLHGQRDSEWCVPFS